MKLLLDECLDEKFRHDVVGHDVYTVSYLGWKGTKNGKLLARAAADDFGGIITTDRGIEHQQNLSQIPLSVYILIDAESNQRPDLLPFASNLVVALSNPPLNPSVVHVHR